MWGTEICTDDGLRVAAFGGIKLRRVFGNQLARRVNKNRRLLIRNLRDAFPFAIVEVSADGWTTDQSTTRLVGGLEVLKFMGIVSHIVKTDIADTQSWRKITIYNGRANKAKKL